MGQLEKYGLYVLCLVIFMILGVALWGDPATLAAERGASRGGSAPIRAPGQTPAAPTKDEKPTIGGKDLDDFFNLGEKAKNSPAKSSDELAKGLLDPAKPPTPTPTPTPGSDQRTSYVIKAGDSYDSIARTQLKDASLRDLIVKLNPEMSPTRMRPGKSIALPSQAEIVARKLGPAGAATDAGAKPANADKSAKDAKPEVGKEPVKPVAPLADGRRTYTVKKGDTFERIATTELGSPKRTAELMAANPGIAPASLRAGQRITLPKK